MEKPFQTGERDLLLKRDQAVTALTDIFHTISAGLSSSGDAFVSNKPFPHGSGRQTLAMDHDLYRGSSGLALFLAAYYSATADESARRLALRCIALVQSAVSRLIVASRDSHDTVLTGGGLTGMSSVLYALTKLADWLKEPEIILSAHELVNVMTGEHIRASQRMDVIGGCAGTLLSLLAFAEEGPALGIDTSNAFELAILCGRRLLDRRISYKGGPRAWPSPEGTPMTGFGYGAAGIAYSLIRLFEGTGLEEFRDAALEGFSFEHNLYIPERKTWLDPWSNHPVAVGSWCTGAPGIVLGRLGSLASVDFSALRHDLQEGLAITSSLPQSQNDQLCCGNFGHIDIMYTAGDALRRLPLIDASWELTGRTLAQAMESGFSFAPAHEAPSSLFLGLAGAGYTLLRLIYPQLLPSVLLLETQP